MQKVYQIICCLTFTHVAGVYTAGVWQWCIQQGCIEQGQGNMLRINEKKVNV